MRILVTLGGTSEKIDDVRSITNHATGTLGTLIASAFEQSGATVDVIASASAIKPNESSKLHVTTIHDTYELSQALERCMKEHVYDAVIHSMAVSDFTTETVYSEEQFLTQMNQWHLTHPNQPLDKESLATFLANKPEVNETKLSSNTNHLVLFLQKTPKVIQMIKSLQPKTCLVGFKLLVDVSKDELFAVAEASRKKSQADFVLANDLTSIAGNDHIGYLLNEHGIVAQAETKPAIAQMLVDQLKHIN